MDAEGTGPGGIHHTDLTEVGIPYGTATYAAPEQAKASGPFALVTAPPESLSPMTIAPSAACCCVDPI